MSATAASPIEVVVNDRPRSLPHGATLADVVAGLGIAGRAGIAAAVNDEVVPRSDWPRRRLAAGERILVIQATQGG